MASSRQRPSNASTVRLQTSALLLIKPEVVRCLWELTFYLPSNQMHTQISVQRIIAKQTKLASHKERCHSGRPRPCSQRPIKDKKQADQRLRPPQWLPEHQWKRAQSVATETITIMPAFGKKISDVLHLLTLSCHQSLINLAASPCYRQDSQAFWCLISGRYKKNRS